MAEPATGTEFAAGPGPAAEVVAAAGGRLAAHGLVLRGGFVFAAGEAAPPGPRGLPARTVLMVGHAGDGHWPHFSAWRAARSADLRDPLDTWSREVIGDAAAAVGALAVSPSDQPYQPFQQWAMRAEGLRPSPLGILMHPEYGLWHAWRGALLFDAALPLPAPRAANHLCDACAGKFCLKACPAGAHRAEGFDHAACLAHVRGPAGGACMGTGCLDRNACPEGAAWRYRPEAQRFHMAAFAR